MFSSEERLKERTGKYGTPRLEYLQALVAEFQNTNSETAKVQIVANLANFSYDPINFEHLRQLAVPDLFLDCLTESDEQLVEFGMGGICNCSPDPKNVAAILAAEGVPLIVSCLSSPVENTVLSAMAALYYLCGPASRKEIMTPQTEALMEQFAAAGHVNRRMSNLAQVFLEKHRGRGRSVSRG